MCPMRAYRCLLLLALVGCEGLAPGPAQLPPAPPPPSPPPRDFSVVVTFDTLDLPSTRWALPADAGLSMRVTTARGELLVGGDDGLHRLTADGGSEQLAAGPVTGLFTLASGDALLVRPDGFSVRTGAAVRESELSSSVPGPVAMVGRDGPRLWLANDATLFRLEGEVLTAFPVPKVHRVEGATDGVLVLHRAGAVEALREAPLPSRQSLSEEQPVVAAVPLAGGAFLAVADGGALWRRELEDGGARWRPLRTGPADAGNAVAADLLGLDPQTGAAWLRVDGGLGRLDGDRLSLTPMEPFSAVALDDVGGLFLRTAGGVLRMGAAAPVRFSEQVQPLSTARCVSCHRQNGTAPPVLETLDQWRVNVDKVLARIGPQVAEQLRMPRNADPLTPEEVARVRRWKEEGFRP